MQKNNLLWHPNTATQVKNILQRPPNTIMITGLDGSGKDTLALYIAAQFLNIEVSHLELNPGFIEIAKPEDKKEIPLESIRELSKALSLKAFVGPKNAISRIVYIKESQLLSHEAQNALLKILEESPALTVFILSVTSQRAVLPTISSRSQRIDIKPVSLIEASSFFSPQFDNSAVQSAWSLSQGMPGLLTSTLASDTAHPLKQAVELSKRFLKMNLYERLLLLDSINNREDFDNFLDGLSRVLRELNQSAISSGKTGQTSKLITSRSMIASARRSLKKNVSMRLISLNLAINLPI